LYFVFVYFIFNPAFRLPLSLIKLSCRTQLYARARHRHRQRVCPSVRLSHASTEN